MQILILGGNGMLGHKIYEVFSGHFNVYATVRRPSSAKIIKEDNLISGINAVDPRAIEELIARVQPDVVINCVGIIKQLREAHDPVSSIATNSLLPHQLAAMCRNAGSRLIHISTDCVFSGVSGGYIESDTPDPIDLYGRTKWIGEVVDEPHALTVRTSIIGRELSGANALIEWFLAQTGPTVPGFTNAIFSGLPTISLARILLSVVQDHPELHGLFHVSADPISKFNLLELVRNAYGLPVQLVPSPDLQIDRSLNSDRFRSVTGWTPLDWPQLVQEMASDPTPYDKLRQSS